MVPTSQGGGQEARQLAEGRAPGAGKEGGGIVHVKGSAQPGDLLVLSVPGRRARLWNAAAWL